MTDTIAINCTLVLAIPLYAIVVALFIIAGEMRDKK
jgi:hypothetical protein